MAVMRMLRWGVFAAGACLWIPAALSGCGHRAAAPPPPAATPARAPDLEGAWLGTLHLGQIHLRVVLHIRRQGAGWAATFDSPDQYAQGIPIDSVLVDGSALTVRASRLQASFEGRLDAAGSAIAGIFRQRGVELPLVLTKTTNPPTTRPRPQEPTRPLPYDEVPLTVDGPSGGAQLACTLTKPRAAGRFPAVVLITGSGPQDRDESLAGHRPFLVLADAITRRGVAVLRCDDRGVGASTGNFEQATTLDFVEDTLAELASLRQRPDIDPARLGLIGHSEGGIIAPIAATRSRDVSFLVLLAPPALPGSQVIDLQAQALAKAKGATDAQVAAGAAITHEVHAIVMAAPDGATAAQRLRARYQSLSEQERAAMDQPPGRVEAEIKRATSPWFRVFLALDPRPYLKQVTVPVLALFGERDLQVLPGANLPELRGALKDNPNVTIRELPGLNHLFQTCQTGLPEEYGQLDETISPSVLALINDWVGHQARP